MARQLVIGGFYRHFKDKLYQVKGTAIHSETKEKMVIYQGLYGEYEMYVRPYDMFLSEVDHIKYPDVVQQYRFELIDIKTGKSLENNYEENCRKNCQNTESDETIVSGNVSTYNDNNSSENKDDIYGYRQSGYKKDVKENLGENTKENIGENIKEDVDGLEKLHKEGIEEKETVQEEAIQDSKLIRFLDAYDYKEKLDILTSMRGELNDGLIDIMAESIEVAVPEGDITDRYNSLRKCLLAHTKYEGLRLRQ